MSDDWESTLSQRHVHNRVGKSGRSSKGGRGGQFDGRQTFGTYKVDCPSYSKLGDGYRSEQPSLEIYGFTSTAEDGLHGKLCLPHLLTATVIFAASRKAMNAIIDELDHRQREQSDDDDEEEEGSDNSDDVDEEEELDDDNRSSSSHTKAPTSRPTFEKNSFRSPKFWLRWQGQLEVASTSTELLQHQERQQQQQQQETNTGYIVFSPDVKKFSGTISCDSLGWSNKAFNGWKAKGASERDADLAWSVV